jgi:hypothetical protein
VIRIGKYDWKTSLATPRHGRYGDIKIILKKNVWRYGLDSYASEHIPTARYFEQGNEIFWLYYRMQISELAKELSVCTA